MDVGTRAYKDESFEVTRYCKRTESWPADAGVVPYAGKNEAAAQPASEVFFSLGRWGGGWQLMGFGNLGSKELEECVEGRFLEGILWGTHGRGPQNLGTWGASFRGPCGSESSTGAVPCDHERRGSQLQGLSYGPLVWALSFFKGL